MRTNRPTFDGYEIRVDRAGVTVMMGDPQRVSWDLLRDAATQADPELRAAYAGLLARAETVAYTISPLRVCYGQDSTNVWWHAYVETAWGGLRVGRKWRTMTIVGADEGGMQARAWMARAEARAIAERIAKISPTHPVQIVAV